MGADITLEYEDKFKILDQAVQKDTVILVDDNEDQLTLLKFLMSIENPTHNIITFSSAENALDFLNRNYPGGFHSINEFFSCVSLIISDYNMYPKNGLEFFKDIKESGIKVPFVLISSFISDKIKNEARKLGIDDCIDKNIDVSKTIRSLSTFLPS